MKKTLSLITAIVMIISLISSFGCVSASADTTSVSLYDSIIYANQRYSISYKLYVKTTGNASDEAVYIHHAFINGAGWYDTEATYVATLDDGSKIWEATVSNYTGRYAIKYVANGVEYWDNNNGENYAFTTAGEAVVSAEPTLSYYNFNNPNGFLNSTIGAKVKNLAYEKEVVARYTTYNWATYTDVPMSYVKTNDNGTEGWQATDIDLDGATVDSFQYCIYYKVNGQTYWANNFGRNYNCDFVVHH